MIKWELSLPVLEAQAPKAGRRLIGKGLVGGGGAAFVPGHTEPCADLN